MLPDNATLFRNISSVLIFPIYFQGMFLQFAWGAGDAFWVTILKRLFLLLPTLALILGLWISIAALLTAIFRHDRRNFVMTLFITWWDLGRATVYFWGGIFRFLAFLGVALLGMLRILVQGIWSIFQNILFTPFRLLRAAGQTVVGSRVPWIAVFLTLFWCLIEAMIFAYVTTPLVIDTFSNITGEVLAVHVIRIPLFVFLFFIVLGSYAVLSTFVDAVKSKSLSSIAGIVVIEIVVILVEVLFLYREFVDSLVPWFAQYSANFDISMSGILAISVFVWFGIRSLSWFLFAEYGTPTIMRVIHGKGLQVAGAEATSGGQQVKPFDFTAEIMTSIKENTSWIQEKSEDLLAAFMLPPLQVIAGAINFLALLISGNHLFDLPFESIGDIQRSGDLLDELSQQRESLSETN
ncbi:MAG TPA: hypothetical protein VKA68_05845 [bacterium]|nr:hypothetical protein [bacterium]